MDDGTIASPSLSVFSSESLIPFLWRCGTIVGGLAAIAVGLLYAKQDSLLYFPAIGNVPRRPGQNPRRYRSPAEHKIPYETHMIRCDDGVTIHSWLLLHPHSRQEGVPTIVFFHGNAGNIGLRLPNAIQIFQHLHANVLMVEYRGYGDSEDVPPSEKGLKLDSEAALKFVIEHPQVDPKRIFLFGRSLGGAVAFHLAQYAERSKIPIAGVIVENTFISISSMVDSLMPFLTPIKPLVLKLDWNSGRIVPSIRVPVMYLAGAKDELVPPFHMQELFNASKKASLCARIHIVKNGTHNDTWLHGGKEYWEKQRRFLAEVFAAEKTGSFLRSDSISDVAGDWNAHNAVDVGMGVETDVAGGGSAIPTMPSNLVGMAREAGASAISTNPDLKKEM